MGISIFAPARPRMMPSGHIGRITTVIRGYQVAAFLGAKLNPTSGYQEDVCIYVKPHIPPGCDFNFEGRAYLDIIDGNQLCSTLTRYPQVRVIACSHEDERRLHQWVKNQVVYIPQHHCNFERVQRNREGIRAVGAIGAPIILDAYPRAIKDGLAARGIQWVEFTSTAERLDVVRFYQSIDVQCVWRPRLHLSNPLKIYNAASFGIPTIAKEECFFGEVEGYYIPVQSAEEWLSAFDTLRFDAGLYQSLSERGIEMAERYHYQNIIPLYQELER